MIFLLLAISRLVALYNNIKKNHREDGRFFLYYYTRQLDDLHLAEQKKS